MKVLLMLCIMALAMSAQTINGVSLGGTPDNPTIINGSGKPVIGYALAATTAAGTGLNLVLDVDWLANGTPIMPGEQRSALGLSRSFYSSRFPAGQEKRQQPTYSLAAVLWSDGSFNGPASIRQGFSDRLYQWRGLARGIQYAPDKYRGMEEDRRALMEEGKVSDRNVLAHLLLGIREVKGESEAEAAVARLAGLPDAKEDK